jgi:hypothetical protein
MGAIAMQGGRPESEMKGLSLRNYPVVLAAMRGEDVAAKMMSLLPPELRDGLASGVITATQWCPVAWKRELHRAGSRATGEPFLARAMGYEMTRRDLNGIYRAFMRLASPQHVLQAGARIFGTYLRPGKYRVVDIRDGFVRVEFTGCYGFDQNMWLDVSGGCEAVLEAAGAKSVRFHIESGAREEATCSAVAWWTTDDAANPPPSSIPPPSNVAAR